MRRYCTNAHNTSLLPTSFKKPSGHWTIQENQIKFFKQLADKLQFTDLDNWYNYTTRDVIDQGGAGLLGLFGGSLHSALNSAYPSHDWKRWRFKHNSRDYWDNRKNQREVLEDIGRNIGVSSLEDWYNHDKESILFKFPVRGLFASNQDSYIETIKNAFPEHEWKIHRFKVVPANYWNDIGHQREFMAFVEGKLGLKDWKDWYLVQQQQVKQLGGAGLLQLHKNTLSEALTKIYPEHDWIMWNFQTLPRNYWKDTSHRRAFFDFCAKKLNVNNWKQWYQVEFKDVMELGGEYLVHFYYHNSLVLALLDIYREHPWKFWEFDDVPTSIWKDFENQKLFLEHVFHELSLTSLDGWYDVDSKTIERYGGAKLLKLYNNNFIKILTAHYPEHLWKGFHYPPEFWDSTQNQRLFVNHLAKDLKIKHWVDWYKTQRKDFVERGGNLLMKRYENSHIKTLKAVLPEHKWQTWKFVHVSSGFWDDKANVLEAISTISEQLGIEHIDDWKTLTPHQLDSLGLNTLRKKYGGVASLLQEIFPGHSFEQVHPSKVQHILLRCVRVMFPDADDIHMSYQHLGMRHKQSNKAMELDVYIPSLSLAFENQGPQHYSNSANNYFEDSDLQKTRDKEKRSECERLLITLVEVPYWWDQTYPSLAASVQKLRPDLNIVKKGDPLSYTPIPEHVTNKGK